jgi:hypothetical protein
LERVGSAFTVGARLAAKSKVMNITHISTLTAGFHDMQALSGLTSFLLFLSFNVQALNLDR